MFPAGYHLEDRGTCSSSKICSMGTLHLAGPNAPYATHSSAPTTSGHTSYDHVPTYVRQWMSPPYGQHLLTYWIEASRD